MASVPKQRSQPISLERIAGVSAWAQQVRRAIELVAARLADAIAEGKSQVAAEAQVSAEGADVAGGEAAKKAAPKARANVKRAVPKPPKV